MARILVVDDRAHVRGGVRRILSRSGHEVRDVPDGAEAVDLMAAVDFDLVVTDVYMTGVDGMELLVRARQRGLRAPAMVISGGGFAPRRPQALGARPARLAQSFPRPAAVRRARRARSG